MAQPGSANDDLTALRDRIDAIDAELHKLLIERSSVIDALIAAKGTARSGVAFRPQREAEMMRRFVERHRGNLPLATVEHLWREIISTFTFMQAPFRLVVHYGADPVAVHDLARFAFGFSVDLERADGPGEVVATVASTGSDLGLIPLETGRFDTPWWRALSMASGPRIMALWPFISGKPKAPDLPAAVVSPALGEASPPDLLLFAAADDRDSGTQIPGVDLIADCRTDGRREALVAATRESAEAALTTAMLRDIAEVGGAAAGISVAGAGDTTSQSRAGDRS